MMMVTETFQLYIKEKVHSRTDHMNRCCLGKAPHRRKPGNGFIASFFKVTYDVR